MQHVAYVWPPCCDLLQHVGCCWLKFENVKIFHATFVDVTCALVRFSTRNMSQHVATGWPNACNNVEICCFKCCDHLAGAYKYWANNVGLCCVVMLLSFGPGFKFEPTTPNMLQHMATRWPNAHNMLCPTMLQYVALACCDRLAGA